MGKALKAARRAVELDRTDSLAHMLLAIAHHYVGDHASSVSEAEIALRLNPSNAQAHFTLGLHLSQSGRSAEGTRAIDNGFRLNPYEPGNHVYFSMMAHAHFTARDYNKAIEWARKAGQLKPQAREPHIILAAALGALGNTGEAQRELEIAESNEHFVTVKGDWFDWQHETDNEHFLEALRNIGWIG